MKRDPANLVLRAGLAFAFLYPPLDALADPSAWIGYFPPFMRLTAQAGGISDLVLLHSFGAIEIIIALWILSGRKIFWPAAAAFAMLIAIVLFGLPDFQILFRDLSIASIALALCVQNYSDAFGKHVANT
jgi:hypothetical protein